MPVPSADVPLNAIVTLRSAFQVLLTATSPVGSNAVKLSRPSPARRTIVRPLPVW
jgi:hypothetical protein